MKREYCVECKQTRTVDDLGNVVKSVGSSCSHGCDQEDQGSDAVQKKISQLRTEAAVVERERLASIDVEDITAADIAAVEDEIGMGRGAWDMVDHRELILACVKVVCGKSV